MAAASDCKSALVADCAGTSVKESAGPRVTLLSTARAIVPAMVAPSRANKKILVVRTWNWLLGTPAPSGAFVRFARARARRSGHICR